MIEFMVLVLTGELNFLQRTVIAGTFADDVYAPNTDWGASSCYRHCFGARRARIGAPKAMVLAAFVPPTVYTLQRNLITSHHQRPTD